MGEPWGLGAPRALGESRDLGELWVPPEVELCFRLSRAAASMQRSRTGTAWGTQEASPLGLPHPGPPPTHLEHPSNRTVSRTAILTYLI